jgi:hypothetical protein
MNVKLILAAVIGCGVAAVLTAGESNKPAASAVGDTLPFQGTTNIVFIHWLSVPTTNELGQVVPKTEQFAVSDAKEIRKFVSSIHFAPGQPLVDDHIFGAKFQRPAGEIFVTFCSHCFDIVDSEHPDRGPHYAMPEGFFTEFSKVAQQHGWKVEKWM